MLYTLAILDTYRIVLYGRLCVEPVAHRAEPTRARVSKNSNLRN